MLGGLGSGGTGLGSGAGVGGLGPGCGCGGPGGTGWGGVWLVRCFSTSTHGILLLLWLVWGRRSRSLELTTKKLPTLYYPQMPNMDINSIF